MDQIPWWAKLAISLGALSFVWKLIDGGIPKAMMWLTSKAVTATAAGMLWLMSKPLIKNFLTSNWGHLEPELRALVDGIKKLLDAVMEEVDKDVEAAAEAQKPDAPKNP